MVTNVKPIAFDLNRVKLEKIDEWEKNGLYEAKKSKSKEKNLKKEKSSNEAPKMDKIEEKMDKTNFQLEVQQISQELMRVAQSHPESLQALQNMIIEAIQTFDASKNRNDLGQLHQELAKKYKQNVSNTSSHNQLTTDSVISDLTRQVAENTKSIEEMQMKLQSIIQSMGNSGVPQIGDPLRRRNK